MLHAKKSIQQFWRRRFLKGFYHIWAWRPSWPCDLDFLYTHWFPLPIDASYKIWLWLAKQFQRRRTLQLWTDGWTTDGLRTDDGRTPDHGHPISSPCEPNGSGELKIKAVKLQHTTTPILAIKTFCRHFCQGTSQQDVILDINKKNKTPICELYVSVKSLKVESKYESPHGKTNIGENKDADQLCGNREADQRLCFRYLDSTIPLLPKSKISSSLLVY